MAEKPLREYYSTKLIGRLRPALIYDGHGGFGMLGLAEAQATDGELREAVRAYYGLDEEVPPHSGRKFESYDKH